MGLVAVNAVLPFLVSGVGKKGTQSTHQVDRDQQVAHPLI